MATPTPTPASQAKPAADPAPPKAAAGADAPLSMDPKDVRIRELEAANAALMDRVPGDHRAGPAYHNPYAPTPPVSVPADWVPGQEGEFAKQRRLAAEKEAKDKDAKPA